MLQYSRSFGSILALAVCFFITPNVGVAASFDCRLAGTAVEQMLCSNAELSRLDDVLADSYKGVLLAMPEDRKPELIAAQRAWLRVRNACADEACVYASLRDRISGLQDEYVAMTNPTAVSAHPAAGDAAAPSAAAAMSAEPPAPPVGDQPAPDAPVEMASASSSAAQSAPLSRQADDDKTLGIFPLNDNIRYLGLNAYLYWAVWSVLLAATFAGYCHWPRARRALIATPYDAGVRQTEEPSDKELATRASRQVAELFLLLGVAGVAYVLFLIGRPPSPASVLVTLKIASIGYLGTHLAYLFFRVSWSMSSTCPKCRTAFAADHLTSSQEPSATFQVTAGSNPRKLVTYEVGTHKKEYVCVICQYEWTKASSYKRMIHEQPL